MHSPSFVDFKVGLEILGYGSKQVPLGLQAIAIITPCNDDLSVLALISESGDGNNPYSSQFISSFR